jgi:hypothetical protein
MVISLAFLAVEIKYKGYHGFGNLGSVLFKNKNLRETFVLLNIQVILKMLLQPALARISYSFYYGTLQ